MKTLERDWQEFTELVARLRDNLIVVEGKKDGRALKTLGLYNVIEISGKPLINVVNEIARALDGRETGLVILTDFDREGRRIANKLIRLLQSYKISPNAGLRNRLMEFGKNKIEDFKMKPGEVRDKVIGSLKYDSFKRGDIYGETGANFNKVHNKSAVKGKGNNRKVRRNRSYFWAN